MPISISRYRSVFTEAETLDYPDFCHWQANVAEDTIVALDMYVLLAC